MYNETLKFTVHDDITLWKELKQILSLFRLFNLATRKMIRAYSLAPVLDYIELNWTNPKFLPERYQLKYMCTMKRTAKYKPGNTNYIVNKTKNLSSVTTSVIISDLHPSSICTVILLAVYNPASTDTGIAFKGVSLGEHTSTCKWNFGSRDFIATLDYCVRLPIYMHSRNLFTNGLINLFVATFICPRIHHNRENMPPLYFCAHSFFLVPSSTFVLYSRYTPLNFCYISSTHIHVPSSWLCGSVTLPAIAGIPHFTIAPCQ